MAAKFPQSIIRKIQSQQAIAAAIEYQCVKNKLAELQAQLDKLLDETLKKKQQLIDAINEHETALEEGIEWELDFENMQLLRIDPEYLC